MATAMTMTIKETQIQNLWAVNIYVDNQAAIRASANPDPLDTSTLGVPGNEEADRAAKTAAQGPRTYSREVFYMLATCKQKLRKRVFRQWAKEWENGVTGRTIFHLEKEPNLGVLTKHTGIRRPLSSLITTQDLREELLGRAHDIRRILKDSALVKAAAILVLRGNLLGQFQDVTEASDDLQAQEKPLEDPGADGSMTANHY
ncbi:MAG: hypothetical protein FRX48_07225 [Lasallia pustulata]|uniref:RNase H type-1 domain-containing protein n=1 Tax=Lasallia pustulata TaxID=136370 RepID=A0A5M8PHL5_9LECA|nr:MAG: hypothetical protein FRX48_07225 [Lasallia pustulata]